MKLGDARNALVQAREHLDSGHTATAIDKIDQALEELEPRQLLTTGEAAELLGVRSVNTVKLWCRNGALSCERVGNRTMIPLMEVERFKDGDEVRAIRVSDQFHDASAELGLREGLDEEEMRNLSVSRPGRLPWRHE